MTNWLPSPLFLLLCQCFNVFLHTKCILWVQVILQFQETDGPGTWNINMLNYFLQCLHCDANRLEIAKQDHSLCRIYVPRNPFYKTESEKKRRVNLLRERFNDEWHRVLDGPQLEALSTPNALTCNSHDWAKPAVGLYLYLGRHHKDAVIIADS